MLSSSLVRFPSDSTKSDWASLTSALSSALPVVTGLLAYLEQNAVLARSAEPPPPLPPVVVSNARYKTSMCRDMTYPGGCPRAEDCTFAHSQEELEQ